MALSLEAERLKVILSCWSMEYQPACDALILCFIPQITTFNHAMTVPFIGGTVAFIGLAMVRLPDNRRQLYVDGRFECPYSMFDTRDGGYFT